MIFERLRGENGRKGIGMAVPRNKTDLEAHIAAQFDGANATTNQITPADEADALRALAALTPFEDASSELAGSRMAPATTDERGAVELATDAESDSASIRDKAITPQGMHAGIAAYGEEDFPSVVRNVRPDWNATQGYASIANKPGDASATADGLFTAANFIKLQELVEAAALVGLSLTLTRFDNENPIVLNFQPAVDARVSAGTQDSVVSVAEANGVVTITKRSGASTTINIPNHQASGLNQSQVDARFYALMQAALTGNTETGITVTWESDHTIDFVVASGGSTPAVSTHQRYASIGADATFIATDFDATNRDGAATTDDIVVSGAPTGRSYLAFWSAEALSSIQQENVFQNVNLLDGRHFPTTPARLTIGGDNGYLYASVVTLPQGAINATWTLR